MRLEQGVCVCQSSGYHALVMRRDLLDMDLWGRIEFKSVFAFCAFADFEDRLA